MVALSDRLPSRVTRGGCCRNVTALTSPAVAFSRTPRPPETCAAWHRVLTEAAGLLRPRVAAGRPSPTACTAASVTIGARRSKRGSRARVPGCSCWSTPPRAALRGCSRALGIPPPSRLSSPLPAARPPRRCMGYFEGAGLSGHRPTAWPRRDARSPASRRGTNPGPLRLPQTGRGRRGHLLCPAPPSGRSR